MNCSFRDVKKMTVCRSSKAIFGMTSSRWYLPVLLLVLAIPAAWSLDEKRLWLPVKYRKYHFDLLASAIATEKDPSCEQIMEGTLDLGLSKPDTPVFRFLCRSPEGPGFNVMVDGKSRQPLTNERSINELLDAQQQAIRRQQLAERVRQQREQKKKSLWEQCEAEIRRQARDMIEFAWREPDMPEPVEFSDVSAVFEKHFRSRNPAGTELFFVASCVVVEGSAPAVKFRGNADRGTVTGGRQ